jgi:glycosyltransferase involved in cell wall biosynthesis
VVVVHPVHQHAYETAVGLQSAGLLRCFVTGLYDHERGLFSPRLQRPLPGWIGNRIAAELRRRRHPELDPGLVDTIARYHAVATVWRRGSKRLPGLRRLTLERRADEAFGKAVGRRLSRGVPPRTVHAFEGTALASFEYARRTGVRTVLDVPSAHEEFRRVVAEERGATPILTTPLTMQMRLERDLADIVLAPSEFVISSLVRNGVNAEKIIMVPYAADPTTFAPRPEESDGEIFRALFVGQIGLRKGVRYLLEAWRRLALPNAELILVGEPDAFGRRMLRDAEGCRWVGAVPKYEVHEWFRRCDVFVFPSLAEGSAYVTYEAMSAGLPLVATPNAGSVVRDGLDGYLVAPRDVSGLCERIQELYENPGLRRALGRSARSLLVSKYTWAHYRARVAAVHRALLAGEDSRRAIGDLERNRSFVGSPT